jgi:ribonuclease D
VKDFISLRRYRMLERLILAMKIGRKKKPVKAVANIYDLLPQVETQFIDGDIPPDIDFGEIVHVDIETSGLDPRKDDLYVVNIGYDPLPDGTFQKAIVLRVVDEISCPTNLRALLTSDVKKIMHNAIFDASWIYTKWKLRTEPVFCTKVLARMTRKFGNSYGALVKVASELEIPKDKSLTMSPWYKEFKDWSPEMRKYCAYDVMKGSLMRFLMSTQC